MEIKLHNKFNVGINENFYNKVKQTSTGFDYIGIKHSNVTKAKISIARLNFNGFKGKTHTKETIQKILKSRINYKHSSETKQKMSVSAKGKIKSKIRCENISKSRCKIIEIYNSNNEICHSCINYLDFRNICKINELPRCNLEISSADKPINKLIN